MSDFVTYSKEGNIGILTVDSPPVNALGVGVRKGLVDCLAEAEADDSEALVLICAGRTFIAGADISEFGKPPQEPNLNVAIEGMEKASKPVVAAIHGSALGGGCEIAMCCHYRVGVPTANYGQPEVLLGIIPGAGGTQRLPRIIGVEKALDMITGGAPIGSTEALELGLIDEIVEGDLREGAIAFAKQLVADGKPLRLIRDMNDNVSNVDPAIFENARKALAKSKRNFDAPQRCVDAVEAACQGKPFDEGLQIESDMFTDTVASDQSAGQRHIFFSQRLAAKIDDVPKDTKLIDVKQAAILGAGTMGGGIAMNFVNAGIPVVLLDTTQEALDRGMGIVEKNYARSVSRGRLTQEAMDRRISMITPSLDLEDFKDADYVVEAVYENMDVKKEMFKKLDAVCKPGAVLASNTSTLDVNEIAEVTSRPEFVVGTHFFSPANVMKLLEVVRGDKTSNEVLATTMAIAKKIKKVPVVVGVCDGFVGNRMLYPYRNQAIFLVEEGASPQQVDAALYNFGMAMGPLATNDLAGLDIAWAVRKNKGIPTDRRYSHIPDRICEAGRFGQKTSAGWYSYEPGSRVPNPDAAVEAIIDAARKENGIEPRDIADEEIVERAIYAMVNEGARILEEGYAQRASDIDVIYNSGYGFPIYRGGPMFYADTVGLKKVYDRICGFEEKFGVEWEPAPLLKKLAEEGGTFN